MSAPRRTPSGVVRGELAHVAVERPCDRRAELAAILRGAGTLHLHGGGRASIEAQVEDPALARRIMGLLREVLGAAAHARMLEPGRGHPRSRVVVEGEDTTMDGLVAAGVLDAAGRPPAGIDRALVRKACCAAAYLRGAFLARGSVSSPRRAAHLEIRAADEDTARALAGLLERAGARASVRLHRGAWTAYSKDVASVGRALAVMGAHEAYLAWEDGAVWKGVRAEAARLANADAANARRNATAALAQVRAAEAIEDGPGLDALAPALREAARLRLAHPNASIDDLARLADPPVSKAAMAGRLRRLARVAQDVAG